MTLLKEDIPIQRDLLLSGEINADKVDTIGKKIFEISYDDATKLEKVVNFEKKPIKLFINSVGGEVYDGIALLDIIRMSETFVHTYCVGCAMSMAFWVFLAGEKRFSGKYSTFLYHEVSSFFGDALEGIKQEIKELERLQALYDAFVLERTKITKSKLEKYKKTKSDWYISAEEALVLGICDELV